MNVGIYAGGNMAANMNGYSSTSINLPNARDAGLTNSQGTGASVEVSLSPQASTMLAIDMDSLARKGYSSVNIDTDGKPGAEISIKVEAGAGKVAVGTENTLGDLHDITDANQTDDTLLQIMINLLNSEDDKTEESQGTDTVSSAMLKIAIQQHNDNLAALDATAPADSNALDAGGQGGQLAQSGAGAASPSSGQAAVNVYLRTAQGV